MVDERFREHLVGLGLSPRTAEVYAYRVEVAARWMAGEGHSLLTCGPMEVATYADTLPNSNSTRRHLRTALMRWWEWKGRDDGPWKAVRVPPKPRMVCKALPKEEATRIHKVARGWHPEGTAVLFGLHLAFRASEIARARWDRFDASMGWYVVEGKGSVVAELPVHPILRAELRNRRNGTAWIFPSPQGARNHVHPTTVWTWVRKVSDEAGVGMVPTHHLRHTALATANDRTGDLRAVQAFARHARPETTSGYTRATEKALRRVMESLDYE